MQRHSSTGIVAALVLGLGIGWLDVGATEVQGTLLLLLVATFVISLLTRSHEVSIALTMSAGLPLAHLASRALTGTGDLQIGMTIVVLPLVVAAHAGRILSRRIDRSAGEFGQATTSGAPSLLPSQILGSALAGVTGIGIPALYAANVVRGQPFSLVLTIGWQSVTLAAWVVITPYILTYWQRSRSAAPKDLSPKELARHAAIATAIAASDAILLPLITRALFVPLGAEGLATAMMWSFAIYLPLDILTYSLLVGLGHASNVQRRLRLSSEREAAMRGELASAQLASLRAQLRPHFLFNALNAASVLAHRGDAVQSSSMLARLSDLLRYVMRDTRHQLVTLGDEISFVQSYLAIERERFPDRLRFTVDIAEDVSSLEVPHLILQPLVENAVQHGIARRRDPGVVAVRCYRENGLLRMSVDNDGANNDAHAPSVEHAGIGISNTRSRLAAIYGTAANIALNLHSTGGATVLVTIPASR